MSNSQRYPLNLNLINNVEDDIIFLACEVIHFIKDLSSCHKLTYLISYLYIFDGVNLLYFKLRLFDLTEFIIRNIKDIKMGLKG